MEKLQERTVDMTVHITFLVGTIFPVVGIMLS